MDNPKTQPRFLYLTIALIILLLLFRSAGWLFLALVSTGITVKSYFKIANAGLAPDLGILNGILNRITRRSSEPTQIAAPSQRDRMLEARTAAKMNELAQLQTVIDNNPASWKNRDSAAAAYDSAEFDVSAFDTSGYESAAFESISPSPDANPANKQCTAGHVNEANATFCGFCGQPAY